LLQLEIILDRSEPHSCKLEVPDRLGEQLQQLGNRLPEALIHALQELTATETTVYQDDSQIVELLASQPTPEVVLAIRPTPALQARMSELLAQNKSGTLTRSEEIELVGVASLTRESIFAPRTLGAVSESSCLQKLADIRMSHLQIARRGGFMLEIIV
jgi:16S rRNA C1402 (ribose-2'-O) methylase RsmI